MKKLKFSLIGIVVLISCQVAIAQNRRVASWQTTDGIVYNGYVAPLPTVLKTQEQLFFYQKEEEGKVEIPLSDDLEWLMVNNDTIVRRHEHQSRSVLMQLLYQGPIQLYRVVQTYQHDQYYLVRNGEWYALNNAQARDATYDALRQNCKRLDIPELINTDWDALALVRQLNDCLGSGQHYAVGQRDYRRHRLGIGYDLQSHERIWRWAKKQLGLTPYLHGPDSYTLVNKIQPYYQKYFSVQYEGQTSRFWPHLLHNIDLSLLSTSERFASTAVNISPGVPIEERIQLHALFLSPGFAVTTSFQSRIKGFLGAGAVFMVPIYLRRKVTLADPDQSISSFPVSTTYRRLIIEEPAVYLQLGLQMRLTPKSEIGLRYRMDYFMHFYRYYDHEDILYSEAFPRSTILASGYRNQIQVRLMYRW